MLFSLAALSFASCALAASTADSPAARQGCALAEQVRLCVNHSSMQRATCSGDDLDCQCTWASRATTCFAPCISDKEFSDGMHVAHGEQDTICSQAAKFGKIAKDKEQQKQDEKNNKGKKRQDQQSTAASPKDINDLNSAHDAPTPADDAAKAKATADSRSAPAKPNAPPQVGGGHGKHAGGSASGTKARKSAAGGDTEFHIAESSAAAIRVSGMVALLGAISLF
ncbi:hypothetical protein H4S02_006263 [Coemansia sp. RSA 2611]|nr:hypothetical protein H4S02_006263 [Coemansia sp. RSA 2611]